MFASHKERTLLASKLGVPVLLMGKDSGSCNSADLHTERKKTMVVTLHNDKTTKYNEIVLL